MAEEMSKVVLVGGGVETEPLDHFVRRSKVDFFDDFLGLHLKKAIAAENTTAQWSTVETDINLAPENVADATNGVVQLTLDSDDIAQVACLYFGDSEQFLIGQGLVFEARVALAVLPTTGTEEVEAAWGLAGEHNADLDTVDVNAWFRCESPTETVLLWETDDAVTNDDDNTAGVTLVAGTYHTYKIDASDDSAVQFYVDGVFIAESDMSGLTSTTAKVQPYFQLSKAKSAANTGVATMYIDYVRITQDRT